MSFLRRLFSAGLAQSAGLTASEARETLDVSTRHLNVPREVLDASEIAVYGPGSVPMRLDYALDDPDAFEGRTRNARISIPVTVPKQSTIKVGTRVVQSGVPVGSAGRGGPDDGGPTSPGGASVMSLAASVQTIGPDATNPRALAPSAAEWQRAALEAPRVNETVAFSASTVETMARHIRFNVEKLTESGTWEETSDYNEALLMLRDDTLSQESMIGSSVRYIFLGGEVYLSVYDNVPVPHIVPLSPLEVNGSTVRRTSILGSTYDANSYTAKTIGGVPAENPSGSQIDAPRLLIRAWTPDDIDGKRAYSSMRAAESAIAELKLIDDLSASLLVSRISGAGILLVPDETSFGDETDDTSSYISKALTDVASICIAQPKLPEAHVPIVITAPSDLIDKWRLLEMNADTDEKLLQLRESANTRVERAVDLPELLLKSTDSNHWSLAASLEMASNYFVARAASRVAAALTIGILVPQLPEEEVGKYRFGTVLTGLVSRARAVTDALQLWDRGLISDDTMREIVGYDGSDKPENPELAQRALMKIAMAQPATFGLAYLESLGLTGIQMTGTTGVAATGPTQQPRTGTDPATRPITGTDSETGRQVPSQDATP